LILHAVFSTSFIKLFLQVCDILIELFQIVKKERRETLDHGEGGGPPPVPSHGKHEHEPDQQGDSLTKS
jgi:hypothetical protein